jgi:hypothetical protein
MVVCAASEALVNSIAAANGFEVLKPIRPFDGITSEDDNSFGNQFGRINTATGKGWVALCFKEI